METATQNASTAATNANTATANATKATESANKATQSATTAANNANEAAQAIFDEKYILTARTEFAKSTRVSPTAKGNAILEKLRGDSWQKQLIGNQLLNYDAWKTVTTNRGTSIFKNNGVTITANADDAFTSHGASTFPTEARISVTEGDIINLSWETDDTADGLVYIFGDDANGSYVSTTNNAATVKKLSYTVPSGVVTVSFRFGASKAGTTINYKNIMINKGSEILPYEPYCGGTASPNSDYPQDIRSVGGMGWFDGELRQGTYGEGGNYMAGDGTSVCNVTSIPCKGGDLVAILRDVNATPLIYWWGDNGFISGQSALIGVTAPSDATHFDFVLYSQAGITPSTVGHVCVTINGKYALIVDECNENLFGGDKLADNIVRYGGTKNDTNGTVEWQCQNVGSNSITPGLTFSPNAQYTIILYGRCLNTSARFVNLGIHYTDGTYSELTFTTINTDSYCRYVTAAGKSVESIRFRWGSNGTILYYDKCGIFEGIVSLEDFIEHQSTRHYIPLDEPLRGINGVADEIVLQEGAYGQYRQNCEIEINGTEKDAKIINNSYRLKLDNCLGMWTIQNSMCTHFQYSTDAYYSTTESYSIDKNGNCDIYKFGFTTLEEYVAWFKENPVGIVYRLANPTFTPFEDQTPFYKLMAYDEVTHVSIVGHEELNPMATIRFPRNEDGALETTNHCEKQLLKIENKAIRAEIEELTAALLALGRE